MKFRITITKEVIEKSLMCGVTDKMPQGMGFSALETYVQSNCAFSKAYNQLVQVRVSSAYVRFFDEEGIEIAREELTNDQKCFVNVFDNMNEKPYERYSLIGQSFDVEIPDAVIEYWYGDAVKAVQKIIDNPILQPL